MNGKDMIYDKKNGLWYERQGDYYIPCLALPKDEARLIGIWGRRHLWYIKQHRQIFYTSLLLSGKLNSYLADLNEHAEEMFSQLVEQIAKREGITEKLKAENQMEWVGRINSIRTAAQEIVNNDLMFI